MLLLYEQVQQKGEDDEVIARAIAGKLGDTPGVSYSLMLLLYEQVQQKGKDDEVIARAIADKLGDTPGVSYSLICCYMNRFSRREKMMRL